MTPLVPIVAIALVTVAVYFFGRDSDAPSDAPMNADFGAWKLGELAQPVIGGEENGLTERAESNLRKLASYMTRWYQPAGEWSLGAVYVRRGLPGVEGHETGHADGLAMDLSNVGPTPRIGALVLMHALFASQDTWKALKHVVLGENGRSLHVEIAVGRSKPPAFHALKDGEMKPWTPDTGSPAAIAGSALWLAAREWYSLRQDE